MVGRKASIASVGSGLRPCRRASARRGLPEGGRQDRPPHQLQFSLCTIVQLIENPALPNLPLEGPVIRPS